MCNPSQLIEGRVELWGIMEELRLNDEIQIGMSKKPFDWRGGSWWIEVWSAWRKDKSSRTVRFHFDRFGVWIFKNNNPEQYKSGFYYPADFKRHLEKHLKVEIAYELRKTSDARGGGAEQPISHVVTAD